VAALPAEVLAFATAPVGATLMKSLFGTPEADGVAMAVRAARIP
jgi:hypothetical protein